MNNRSMPTCSMIPVLAYPDVLLAIDWLCKTFGFTERWRAGTHRAQLAYGDGCIAVTESKTPSTGSRFFSIMVRVPDVDVHYQQSVRLGARPLHAPAEFPYGEKQYSVEDIGGYVWTFSESIKDVAPEAWGGVSGPSLKF